MRARGIVRFAEDAYPRLNISSERRDGKTELMITLRVIDDYKSLLVRVFERFTELQINPCK